MLLLLMLQCVLLLRRRRILLVQLHIVESLRAALRGVQEAAVCRLAGEQAAAPLRQRVLRAKRTKRLRLFRLHQFIVHALIHSVRMQGAPEPLINLLNLPGQALSRVIGCLAGAAHASGRGDVRCCAGFGSGAAAQLRLDLPKMMMVATLPCYWLGWLSAAAASCLRTLMPLEELVVGEAIFDLELDYLWVAWRARTRLPRLDVAVASSVQCSGIFE